MRKPAQALLVASTLALAVGVSGCALGAKRSGFASKIDKGNIGVAIRAQAALESGDAATAVKFAERAVENSPTDAGFRTLLINWGDEPDELSLDLAPHGIHAVKARDFWTDAGVGRYRSSRTCGSRAFTSESGRCGGAPAR